MESLDDILDEFGVLPKDLQISLGVTYEAVRLWRNGRNRITPTVAREIELKFGIPRHRLRPDIWDPPPEPSRKREAAAADAR
jgi:DNA-binding transcriptional regulator YdaS (Cro superfamily)